MNQMKTQAELFALDHGSYRGTLTAGFSDNEIVVCNGSNGSFDGSVFEDIDSTVSKFINEIHDISSGSGAVRLFCAVSGAAAEDSWAFAAPLYSPGTGNTGWCVDSSGNSKEVSFDMNNPNTTILGGRSSLSICP